MLLAHFAAGDIIVGSGENCNVSTILDGVWSMCWDGDEGRFGQWLYGKLGEDPEAACRERGGGRLYIRSGQHSWNGAILVPEKSTLHIVGPTSAQVCGMPFSASALSYRRE